MMIKKGVIHITYVFYINDNECGKTNNKQIAKLFEKTRRFDSVVKLKDDEILDSDTSNTNTINVYEIEYYDNYSHKWRTRKVAMTEIEYEILENTCHSVMDKLISRAWVPPSIFKKRVIESLSILGYVGCNNIVKGNSSRNTSDTVPQVEPYKVFSMYFNKGDLYE